MTGPRGRRGPLGRSRTDTRIEPGRRAALTLGSLAFLHFEAPNAPGARTVVDRRPGRDHRTRPTLDDLLDGLASDPYVDAREPAALLRLARSSAPNGAPTTRAPRPGRALHMVVGQPSTPSSPRARRDDAFAPAIPTAPEATTLRVALARAEIARRAGRRARRRIDARRRRAVGPDSTTSASTTGAVTLTGPGTAAARDRLPTAPPTRSTLVVHLITDRLTFPEGPTCRCPSTRRSSRCASPTARHQGSSV